MLYELATMRPPFMGKDMDKLYKKVVSGHFQPISVKYSDFLQGLVSKLLKVMPHERPSCEEIL